MADSPTLRFADLDVLRSYVGSRSADEDLMLRIVLAGAEEFAERYTRRRFAPDPPLDDEGKDTGEPVTKRFTTRGRTVIRIPDLRAVDETAGGVNLYGRRLLAASQYFLGAGGYPESTEPGDVIQHEPATTITLGYGAGGEDLAASFAFIMPLGYQANDLSITGRWGWTPTPPSLLDAVYSLAARRYRERDASWSDTVVTPEGGALSYFRQMPAAVQAELDRFREPNFGMI